MIILEKHSFVRSSKKISHNWTRTIFHFHFESRRALQFTCHLTTSSSTLFAVSLSARFFPLISASRRRLGMDNAEQKRKRKKLWNSRRKFFILCFKAFLHVFFRLHNKRISSRWMWKGEILIKLYGAFCVSRYIVFTSHLSAQGLIRKTSSIPQRIGK